MIRWQEHSSRQKHRKGTFFVQVYFSSLSLDWANYTGKIFLSIGKECDHSELSYANS